MRGKDTLEDFRTEDDLRSAFLGRLFSLSFSMIILIHTSPVKHRLRLISKSILDYVGS